MVFESVAGRVIFREGICEFVQDFEAQIEAAPSPAHAFGRRPRPSNRGHSPLAGTNRPSRIGSVRFSPISMPFRQRCHFPEKSAPRKSTRSRQENTVKSNFNPPGDHLAGTNMPLRIGFDGFSPISRPLRRRCHFPEKSAP